jgi:hypothetical protein
VYYCGQLWWDASIDLHVEGLSKLNRTSAGCSKQNCVHPSPNKQVQYTTTTMAPMDLMRVGVLKLVMCVWSTRALQAGTRTMHP